MTIEKKSKILDIYFYSVIVISIVAIIPNNPEFVGISFPLLMIGGFLFFMGLYHFNFKIQLTNKTKELYPELYEKYKSLNRDWKTYSIYVDNFYTNKHKNEMEKDFRDLENKEVTELFFISKKCSRFGVISFFSIIVLAFFKLILMNWVY